jgi:hypothetical protein
MDPHDLEFAHIMAFVYPIIIPFLMPTIVVVCHSIRSFMYRILRIFTAILRIIIVIFMEWPAFGLNIYNNVKLQIVCSALVCMVLNAKLAFDCITAETAWPKVFILILVTCAAELGTVLLFCVNFGRLERPRSVPGENIPHPLYGSMTWR